MSSRRGVGLLQISVPAPMRFVKRPSAFNACVGARLRGQTYPKPAAGMGGRRNKAVQDAFTAAAQGCRGTRAAA